MAAKKPATAKRKAAAADPVVASSARELADLVGRSHTAVNRWLKDERWTFGKGPWRAADVARISQWAAAELVERPAAAPEIPDPTTAAVAGGGGIESLSVAKRADVALKLTRRQVLQFGLEVQQGKYHAVDACEQRRVRAAAQVKQDLLTLADSLPVDPDVKAMIRGRAIEILHRYAKGLGVAAKVLDAVPAAAAG